MKTEDTGDEVQPPSSAVQNQVNVLTQQMGEMMNQMQMLSNALSNLAPWVGQPIQQDPAAAFFQTPVFPDTEWPDDVEIHDMDATSSHEATMILTGSGHPVEVFPQGEYS